MLNKKALSGTGGAAAVYVEDVFSTYLYTGTGASQTITNNIDLSGKGGLTWIKSRSGATGHRLTDTVRGVTKSLASETTAAQATETTGLTAFGSTGFTIGADTDYNTSSDTYAAFTFREQAKFFDVVTFTQSGTTGNQTISHSLGSIPGMIIIKATSTTDAWFVQHRSITDGYLSLNTADPKAGTQTPCANVTSTSFDFKIGTFGAGNGVTYVAYLFAHNAGGFGAAGTDNVISCGSYTGNGSTTGTVINLGYEPQYLLIKNTTGTGNWQLIDVMRGMPVGSADATLQANLSNAESAVEYVSPTATGFQITSTSTEVNTNASTYIYMAIRRPMKPPTSGTEVFSPDLGSSSGTITFDAGFPVDLMVYQSKSGASGENPFWDRLRGGEYLTSNSTNAKTTDANGKFDSNTKWYYNASADFSDYIGWAFRRATGFFDVVVYSGNDGASSLNIPHNLGVAPELMIVKRRLSADAWAVYAAPVGNTKYLTLNATTAATTGSSWWNNTTPSATTFTVGTNGETNPPATANNCVAYLFATCPGVSKVGSYTGNGTTQAIACGFTGGARFVLIKRTDSTGDWYVYDTARGIVAGNDPHLSLNTTAGEVTTDDSIDADSSGFVVNQLAATNINVSSATYIFLAIA
jgi:hypothetical protein